MGGHIKVESKIGLGTKFIINVKTKCKLGLVPCESSYSQEMFESIESSPYNENYVFMSKDNKDT